jgi:hypothetical protein
MFVYGVTLKLDDLAPRVKYPKTKLDDPCKSRIEYHLRRGGVGIIYVDKDYFLMMVEASRAEVSIDSPPVLSSPSLRILPLT